MVIAPANTSSCDTRRYQQSRSRPKLSSQLGLQELSLCPLSARGRYRVDAPDFLPPISNAKAPLGPRAKFLARHPCPGSGVPRTQRPAERTRRGGGGGYVPRRLCPLPGHGSLQRSAATVRRHSLREQSQRHPPRPASPPCPQHGPGAPSMLRTAVDDGVVGFGLFSCIFCLAAGHLEVDERGRIPRPIGLATPFAPVRGSGKHRTAILRPCCMGGGGTGRHGNRRGGNRGVYDRANRRHRQPRRGGAELANRPRHSIGDT